MFEESRTFEEVKDLLYLSVILEFFKKFVHLQGFWVKSA